ncbi:MAG: class II aldolase/adducin family protein, partial [Deltaproteobacteria bacterium]|nr:class II aldolase/adducin family protein [Deltaproteobacteria bacterium]
AVLHAHPPTASGFALAGVELAPVATPEIAVSLGDQIPLLPFALPGSEPLERAVAAAAERCDALLLERNGALALGDDLEQAYLRLELVEHYARQLLVARQLGGPSPLAADQLATLLKARAKAGLGPEARGLLRSEGLSARPSAVEETAPAFTQAARLLRSEGLSARPSAVEETAPAFTQAARLLSSEGLSARPSAVEETSPAFTQAARKR